MTDRSSSHDRDQPGPKSGADGAGKDARRFTGEGKGERGYRGRSAPDTPPGMVPGGSYGAGGGYSQGDLPSGDNASRTDTAEAGSSDTGADPDRRTDDEEEDFWRDAYGAYGFSRQDEPERRTGMSGYGAQGFGAGEQRSAQWGGGARGGYGGGMPGPDVTRDTRASRGSAWGERGRQRRDRG